MSTNGLISFGDIIAFFTSSLFPTESATTYFAYAVAPYWSDNDARLYGRVSWEMFALGDSPLTDDIIGRVNDFININVENASSFAGSFVFVGSWSEMHPYPAGANEQQAIPYLNNVSRYTDKNF